jgi:DNA mismatch repair protein MSH3
VDSGESNKRVSTPPMPPRASSGAQHGGQQAISRFFPVNASGKRARSPVDLTLDSDEEQPAKRAKIADNTTSTTFRANKSHPIESPIKKKYKFVTMEDSPPPKPKAVDLATKRKQEKRRKELKETLKQTFNQTNGRGSSPPSEVDDTIDLTGQSTDDEDSDGKMKRLRNLYESTLVANKRTGSTQSGKSKKDDLIGPSGQPYTPLELQVSARPTYIYYDLNSSAVG